MAYVGRLPKKVLYSSEVCDILEQAIIAHEIKPGDRIIETQWAKKLDVSQAPVREAIRELETRGYLKRIPYKGAVVREVTTKELLQSYRIRVELDCIAIEEACDNITNTELSELKKSLELMEQAAENNDYLTYIKCNTRFHTIIYEASDNSLLIRFWQQCNVESCICTSTPLLRENLVELAKRHEVLYEVLLQRDKKQAVQEAREHLRTLMDEIKRLDSLS